MLGFSLRLRLTCATCGQDYDADEAHDTAIEKNLFGQYFYTVCWTCGQVVPEKVSVSVAFRRDWLSRLVDAIKHKAGESGLWALARALKVDGGFAPFVRCRWKRVACEFISYPWVEGNELKILAREVEKPWTMEYLTVDKVLPLDVSRRPVLAGLFDRATA